MRWERPQLQDWQHFLAPLHCTALPLPGPCPAPARPLPGPCPAPARPLHCTVLLPAQLTMRYTWLAEVRLMPTLPDLMLSRKTAAGGKGGGSK